MELEQVCEECCGSLGVMAWWLWGWLCYKCLVT